jgi:hypothetical protein
MKTSIQNILNRKNKKIPVFSALIIVCTLIAACKKFVVIPPPTTQLVTASVFNNNATATSAMTSIYSQMKIESAQAALDNGMLSDEITSYNNSPYYLNAMTSTPAYGDWTTEFNYIYQANAVIDGLQQYKGTSPAVKQQLTGEAYFLRAFYLFYISNCYGAIPITLTTNYQTNLLLTRSPRLQVLQQVIADLKISQTMLNNNYIDGSDTVTTTDKVRPNKATATALLARAYLYLGDYDNQNATDYPKADSAATAVINNNLYGLSPLNSVFLIDSKEAIWQLATPLPTTVNTYDGNGFILLAAPGTSNNTVSPQLLNAFEANDQRRSNWIGFITAAGKTYYYPYKYKVQTGGAPLTEYVMVLRLAEQYLIRAEARVHEGNINGAVADLNVIRSRAGLTNYAGATDQSSLLTAILHERQVELFTEWGHRWFDLNRALNTSSTVNVNTVMSVVTPFKGGTWSTDGHQQLYPIPGNDIQIDPKLTQNPGY